MTHICNINFPLRDKLEKTRKVVNNMNQKIIERANEIIGRGNVFNKNFVASLALVDEQGYPTASTALVVRADGINQLTFSIVRGQNKANRAAANSRASVCISSDDYNITLIGDVEILTDSVSKEENWIPGWSDRHFKAVDNNDYLVLRFTAKRYSLFIDYEQVYGEF